MTRRLVSGVAVGMLAAAFAGSVAAQRSRKPIHGLRRRDRRTATRTTARLRGSTAATHRATTSCAAAATTARWASPATSAGARATGRRRWRSPNASPTSFRSRAAPPPPPAAAPPPPAACTGSRPPPAPQVQKITLASKALFDFDKAVLKPEGKAAIDSEIISKLSGVQKLELVLVTGHTDRIGTQQYNQRLSERRADAVRDYLVSRACRATRSKRSAWARRSRFRASSATRRR